MRRDNVGKIQLVNIDPSDVYYYGGTLKLDAERFLWLKLHQNGYNYVCFLAFSQAGISIKDYEDKGRVQFAYEDKKSFLGFLNTNRTIKVADDNTDDVIKCFGSQEFKSFVLPELKRRKNAMICSLDDFIESVKIDEWNAVFRDFAKGRSEARLFITYSSEESVKLENEMVRSFFIPESYNNPICFSNISQEDAKNIILNILLNNEERNDAVKNVEDLTRYLCIIADESVPVDSEFGLSEKIISRSECYDYLEGAHGWNALCNCSRYVSEECIFSIFQPESLKHIHIYINDKGKPEGTFVEDEDESFKERFISFWKEDTNESNNYIKYCLMVLCRELFKNNIPQEDHFTKGILYLALNCFLEFYTTKEVSNEIKEFIAGDFLRFYLDCIDFSLKRIYEPQNKWRRDDNDKNTRRKEIDKNSAELEKRLEYLNSIFINVSLFIDYPDEELYDKKRQDAVEKYLSYVNRPRDYQEIYDWRDI